MSRTADCQIFHAFREFLGKESPDKKIDNYKHHNSIL